MNKTRRHARGMETEFIFKDYYRILRIETTAGPPEIKAAFRKLARETHPDATGDAKNYEKFVLIREAYDILTNPRKRPEYDELREAYYKLKKGESPGNANYYDEVFQNFNMGENYFYRDEWEFFVKNPEDYLSLFESALKMFTASLLSLLAGLAAPIGVFAGIILGISLVSLAAGLILGALLSSSMTSVAVIILTLRLYRHLRRAIHRGVRRLIGIMGKGIVRPLRGIPRHIGKWFLYFNYTAAFGVLSLFSYVIVRWGYTELLDVPQGGVALPGYHWIALFAVAVVLLFSASLVVIFEVLKEALLEYPQIEYSRIRIKKQREINYQAQRLIGTD